MKTVSALDLRRRVGQLMDEASAGERIIIERAGHPVCALVPLKDLELTDPDRQLVREREALDGLRRLARRFPFPEGFDSAAVIRQGREERHAQIMRNVEESHRRRGST